MDMRGMSPSSVLADNGYPFIMYNDADDISHPRRVEVVRAAFSANPLVDLVYFNVHRDRREPPGNSRQ